MLSFSYYWPFALLLALPILWRVGQRTATGLSERHLRVSMIARTIVVVLLTLALTRPVWHRAGTWISVVYALDVSESVSPNFVDSAIDWIDESVREGAPAHAHYVAFAATAQGATSAQNIRSVRVSSDGAAGTIDRSSTDLEAAVSHALRNFDPRYLKRLVLITDGNETHGDVLATLGRAEEQGVRVFVMPATVRAEDDAWIETIVLPERPRQDEPIVADVQVVSRANATATVELLAADAALASRQVMLTPGLNRIPFEISLADIGPLALEARVRAEGDSYPDNDVYWQPVIVGERPRVLYVEGHPSSAHYLLRALQSEGIDVITLGPAQLPDDASSLQDFDVVILSDVPRQTLSQGRMNALVGYVRDRGGGLLFAGGETSYGENGYSETTVEEILPIWFRINERRKDLALVIVLDKSFSMVGPKIELSKEAAKAALDLLEDTHRFGLVTFDHSPYWTVPLQLASNKSRIKEYISSVIASAHTNIYPALEKAYQRLSDTEADVRHVILLSDGKTYPDDYETMVTQMAEAEITVSTVAVGEEADRDLLSDIAEWGNGRAYYIRDANRVPQIFIEETQIASQQTLVEEDVQLVVKRSIEAFRGIDFGSAPPLRGYVSTRPKDTAEVLLESETAAPVLARWQYGLGKSAVFTSDVKNRWAVNWLNWEGYGKFWAQLVRETMRRQSDEGVGFGLWRDGDDAVIQVNAVDEEGRYSNDLDAGLTVVAPDGTTSTLAVSQVGPGAYRAKFPVRSSAASPYDFRLDTGDGNEQTRVLFYPYSDEQRHYPVNVELLGTIAAQTGGKFLPDNAEIFDHHGERTTLPTPLWPYLAALALLGYLMDIALRRAPWVWAKFTTP